MRDLNVEEQQSVAGGMAVSSEIASWLPINVLAALRGGLEIGPGQIGLPRWTPGLIPGPVVLPSPIYLGNPGGLPYEC